MSGGYCRPLLHHLQGRRRVLFMPMLGKHGQRQSLHGAKGNYLVWRCFAIGDRVRRQVSRFARPAIPGTLAGSAAMNSFAFAQAAAGPIMTAAAITMGIAVPALVYALTRVGAALYIDTHSRG